VVAGPPNPKTPEFGEPPLIEAVFDLFVEPSHELDKAVVDRFFEAFPELTGEVEELRQFGMMMQVKGGRPAAQAMSSEDSGTRRWNEGRSRGVLFGPAVLAVNLLHKPGAPYGHFEEHAPWLQKIIERFYEIAKPKRVLWAGHRYINQVPIELAEGVTGADLFALYPALPAEHAKTHPGVAVQVEAGRFSGGVVVANLALAVKNIKQAVYSLDIYAKTEGPVPEVQGLMDWHHNAHRQVVDTFLSSITERARRRFQERR
jgi:uncharacterized protein (TIGR04255 family)